MALLMWDSPGICYGIARMSTSLSCKNTKARYLYPSISLVLSQYNAEWKLVTLEKVYILKVHMFGMFTIIIN